MSILSKRLTAWANDVMQRTNIIGCDQDLRDAAREIEAMEKAIAVLTGHLINAAVVLESGGTKKEAIRVIDAGIEIGKKMGAV